MVDVKRLIRQKETRKFLKSDGGWTTDACEARLFEGLRAVVASKQKLDLTGVELVLMIEDTPGEDTPDDYQVVIPL